MTEGRPKLKLTIEGQGLVARDSAYRVILGDVDISAHLLGVTLAMGIEDVNQATIKLLPDAVEVDAEVLAHLQAQLEEQG